MMEEIRKKKKKEKEKIREKKKKKKKKKRKTLPQTRYFEWPIHSKKTLLGMQYS